MRRGQRRLGGSLSRVPLPSSSPQMSRLASARSLFPHSSSEGLFGVVSQTRETRMLEPPTVLGKTRLYGRLRGSGGLSRNYPASGSSDADPGDTHKEGHWDPHRSHAS